MAGREHRQNSKGDKKEKKLKREPDMNQKILKEIERILREHKEELRGRFKVREIGIFGSYVRGEQSGVSDIDILVDFYEPVGWEIVDLREYLEGLLGVKVDLVTKNGVMRKPKLWKYIREELIHV